jgi:hypothetical protein
MPSRDWQGIMFEFDGPEHEADEVHLHMYVDGPNTIRLEGCIYNEAFSWHAEICRVEALVLAEALIRLANSPEAQGKDKATNA